MKSSIDGPCGLYCGACGATDCDGCRSEPVDDSVAKCKFRQCWMEKGTEFCCFCDEYPCEDLHAFMNDPWPHHWTMKPNLEFILKHGKEKWLKAQAKEWSCKQCGAETKWYQEACPCGRNLDAWTPPPMDDMEISGPPTVESP